MSASLWPGSELLVQTFSVDYTKEELRGYDIELIRLLFVGANDV